MDTDENKMVRLKIRSLDSEWLLELKRLDFPAANPRLSVFIRGLNYLVPAKGVR
jgi:hypothetical protein